MRGNPRNPPNRCAFCGSIPARAGEPRTGKPVAGSCGVYPRACGGTVGDTRRVLVSRGLSPRVRGNLRALARLLVRFGSIPARAGEPQSTPANRTISEVYPRACGGTFANITNMAQGDGLSPRVRGNLPIVCVINERVRSIPARAGEPSAFTSSQSSSRVYPRACGGTGGCPTSCQYARGLSPRVRGNRWAGHPPAKHDGSIPARAGEPNARATGRWQPAVYPRACGGTGQPIAPSSGLFGLSPRVRGNQSRSWSSMQPAGSIPARAGEPTQGGNNSGAKPVYPRACGGTSASRPSTGTTTGLSPRVRGNLRRLPRLHRPDRSIPARAGEPGSRNWSPPTGGVYPRACGGTASLETLTDVPQGLSPRVRGNRRGQAPATA